MNQVSSLKLLWEKIKKEAQQVCETEPALIKYIDATILAHQSLLSSLSFLLASKLHHESVTEHILQDIFDDVFSSDAKTQEAIYRDIQALIDRDSACHTFLSAFLYYKGFHALQAWRATHLLWSKNRKPLALMLQNRISVVFDVDIHPAAKIGQGVMLDHSTGLVVGETAVIEDCVSILQGVTLGGTGKESGDRHPKVRSGVLIGPGATILGNIEIGEGSKIIAASVVLKNVPPHSVASGVPAEIVGATNIGSPAEIMDHGLSG
tara:strand:- start:4830 stop:5621 length:792 start_codon:yes stop_codon:yes gene_type:complete